MSISFLRIALWGLAVLISFIGWGSELEARLFGSRTADAGLRAVWGMAFMLFICGIGGLFRIFNQPVIVIVVVAGVILAGVDAVRRTRDRDLLKKWGGIVGLSLLALFATGAFLLYLASILDLRFNPNDDYIAYFPFVRQIIQQGTLFDPFSTRRVMAFGGQSFLQALVLSGAPYYRLHVFDEGICLLITALLIIGSKKRDGSALPPLLALMLLVAVPTIRLNSSPEVSGVALFYGLFRTFQWLDERTDSSRRIASAAIASLVAIAACTLRSNFVAVAVPMVACSYALRFAWSRGQRAEVAREGGWSALFGFVFLLPWMIMSFQSSGTPLFPLIRGHLNPAFWMLQDPKNWHDQWAALTGTVRENEFLKLFPLFVIGALIVRDDGARKPLRSLVLAALLGYVMLVFTLASDVPSFLRYVYGFVVPVALAAITACTARFERGRRTEIVVILAALIQLALLIDYAHYRIRDAYRAVVHMASMPIPTLEQSAAWAHYQALQARVPPGERLLVMVDLPFMLDYTRNTIYNIDSAAAVSPPPGFPYFQGPDRVAQYLRSQGIRWVAFVRPERAMELYSWGFWAYQMRTPGAFWRAHARIYLDLFENFGSLAATHGRDYDDGSMLLIDLSRPAGKLPDSATGSSRSAGNPDRRAAD